MAIKLPNFVERREFSFFKPSYLQGTEATGRIGFLREAGPTSAPKAKLKLRSVSDQVWKLSLLSTSDLL